MANSIQIAGSVSLGPLGVCEGSFPAALTTFSFGVGSSCGSCASKPAARSAQGTPTIDSPVSYTPLPGLGAGGSVTKANTIYLKTTSPALLLRMTFAVPSASDLVLTGIPLSGTLIQEYPAGRELKLIEVMGSGDLEYILTGDS